MFSLKTLWRRTFGRYCRYRIRENGVLYLFWARKLYSYVTYHRCGDKEETWRIVLTERGNYVYIGPGGLRSDSSLRPLIHEAVPEADREVAAERMLPSTRIRRL